MEKTEYQIEYKWEEEPLLVLPLCVGGMLLSGNLFSWILSLEPEAAGSGRFLFLKLLYWGVLLFCSALAAWRLIRTIHVTKEGLQYRLLGRTQRTISWTEFSCATFGRIRQMRMNMVFLIPVDLGEPPMGSGEKSQFLTANYHRIIHFHGTKHNIRAISTFLGGLDEP